MCRHHFSHSFEDPAHQWHAFSDFEGCLEHVMTQWADSRHNPNYSRFDAVNNKYDNMAMPPEIAQSEFSLRTLQPPLINKKLYTSWLYTSHSAA